MADEENNAPMKNTNDIVSIPTEDALFNEVSALIEESRRHVAKAVNTAMVYTYYGVGQYIVDYEQGGNYRAAYGKGVLARLSSKLTDKYGRGWSVETLTKCRKFYNIYAISSAPRTELAVKANSTLFTGQSAASG